MPKDENQPPKLSVVESIADAAKKTKERKQRAKLGGEGITDAEMFDSVIDEMIEAKDKDHGFIVMIDKGGAQVTGISGLGSIDIAIMIAKLYRARPELEHFVNGMVMKVKD